jgi:tRNA pseudouridine32 synthase/23S rRNA pseudouridine746 synthase/23S rRNA pseudouridine1911/1915/1917 synthase
MAEEGHPVVGDTKYGRDTKYPHLALHSKSISFTHPFSGKRVTFEAEVPAYFDALIGR